MHITAFKSHKSQKESHKSLLNLKTKSPVEDPLHLNLAMQNLFGRFIYIYYVYNKKLL